MFSFTTSLLYLLSITPSLSAARPNSQRYQFSNEFSSAPSTVELTLPSLSNLDGPKVLDINETTWDWWYFDAVSSDLPNGDLSSITIVFYLGARSGFGLLPNTNTSLAAQISGTYTNGTVFAMMHDPVVAEVATVGRGSSGRWDDLGGWWSNSDATEYEIWWNDEELDMRGCLRIEAVS
jgi:hypothetical protein